MSARSGRCLRAWIAIKLGSVDVSGHREAGSEPQSKELRLNNRIVDRGVCLPHGAQGLRHDRHDRHDMAVPLGTS
jgi:hypothetical protein